MQPIEYIAMLIVIALLNIAMQHTASNVRNGYNTKSSGCLAR
jgi:hypothetical protein